MALLLPLIIMGLVTAALVISFGKGSSSEDQLGPAPNTDISPVTDIPPAGEEEIQVPPSNTSSRAAVHPPHRNVVGHGDTTAAPFDHKGSPQGADTFSLPNKKRQMVIRSSAQPRVGRDDDEGRYQFPVPPSDNRHHGQAVSDVASDANATVAQVASTQKPSTSTSVTVTPTPPRVARERTSLKAQTTGLKGLTRRGTGSSPSKRNMDADIWASFRSLVAAMRTAHPARPSRPNGPGRRPISAATQPRKAQTTFHEEIPNGVMDIAVTDVHKEPVDVKDEDDFRKEHDNAVAERKLRKKVDRAARVLHAGAPKLPYFNDRAELSPPFSGQ